MGNCCETAEDGDKTARTIGKKKRFTRIESHSPSSEKCEPVEEMSTLNKKVIEILSTLDPFNPETEEDFTHLPSLGPYKYPEEGTYEGQYENSQRCGFGKQIFKDGSVYEGYWKNDQCNGLGRVIHPDGDVYIGNWVEGKAKGTGEFTHADGTRYVGEWVDDLQNGRGRETWVDGSWYEGEFSDGVKDGRGLFVWSDGSRYEGEFKDNRISGHGKFEFKLLKLGTYQWTDGKIYTGEWANAKMDGKGVFRWPDGRVYVGGYSWDKKSGYGVLKWYSKLVKRLLGQMGRCIRVGGRMDLWMGKGGSIWETGNGSKACGRRAKRSRILPNIYFCIESFLGLGAFSAWLYEFCWFG